jgi:hypothetical protein
MRQLFFLKDEYISREMTKTDGFMIVANGCVELFTEFEGNEFIIERVQVGGILNARSFLVEDLV